MREFTPEHKYAVVMSAVGMLEGANAFLNGLDYYDNPVDFHVILDDGEKDWPKKVSEIKGLQPRLVAYSLDYLLKLWPVDKKPGWQVRYYRYKVAEVIAKNYDALMIVDADVLCLNNIMQYFKLAKDSGFLIMPTNPWGMALERVKKEGISGIDGASSPPFHNMPLFIDPKKWNWLLKRVWYWGLKEDFGDMATLSRTLYREKLFDQVFALPNCFWILSTFYLNFVKRVKTVDNKIYLKCSEEKINMVHRRWWIPDVCKKFITAIKEDDNLKKGRNNVKLFWEEYKRLNTEHKVKINFPYKWPFSNHDN